MIEVVDNFVDEDQWSHLTTLLTNHTVRWTYNIVIEDNQLLCDKKYNHQYVHHIYYIKDQVYSSYYSNMTPILEKLNVKTLHRCKVNAISRENKIVVHGFHTDMPIIKNMHNMKTSILYLNTNNGFTVFEDGTKVESIANRMVTFPMHYKHSGTTCTDIDRRVAINFCYTQS